MHDRKDLWVSIWFANPHQKPINFLWEAGLKKWEMNWKIWYFRPQPPFRCLIVWHRHRFDVKIHESRVVTRFHLTRKILMRKFAFSQQILIRWRQVTQLAYSCTRTRLHCTALTSELAWACPASLCTVTTKITMVFSTKLDSLIKLNHSEQKVTIQEKYHSMKGYIFRIKISKN